MPEKNDLTFEESLKKLEGIVSYLDSGRADLDSSLAKYEEAMGLLNICRAKLSEAEQKIEMLRKADPETGTVETEPVDPDQLRSDESTAGRGTAAKRPRGSKKTEGEPELF
ncbi:MAG: exodeoxyribonuclease VII small subunit [Thermoguttaceae bacterium]|nr:exodeoxyribonuclease VII small subunit [Thermoguttaceae bacterium]